MSMTGKFTKFMRMAIASVVLAGVALVGAATPAHAAANLIIGSTWDPSEYDNQIPKYSDPGVIRTDGVEITRVFFTAAQGCPGGGNPWNDSRIVKLKAHDIIPFISWKTYDTACLTSMLNSLPADIPIAYFTYFHEPEQDMDAATFKSRSVAMWNTFKAHPKYTAGRVKYMTIQTKQWTFLHGGGNYGTYWCGCGDFFAVDMYANSWEASYPDPDAFLTTEQLFGLNVAHKPLFFPEWGAARKSTDSSGVGRKNWMNQVFYRMYTWGNIRGVIWWDDLGTGGVDFRLDPSTAETSPEAVFWKNSLSYN